MSGLFDLPPKLIVRDALPILQLRVGFLKNGPQRSPVTVGKLFRFGLVLHTHKYSNRLV